MGGRQSDRRIVDAHRTGRRNVLGGLIAGVALTGAGHVPGAAAQATPAAEAGAAGQRVYFGWLLATPELVAVAFDFDAPASADTSSLRAYVCDGFGPPEGMAVWFKGTIDKAALEANEEGALFLSASGQETLAVRSRSDSAVAGAFTAADGTARYFAAFRAIDGAGIYDVTLDDDLRYRGTSTDGAVLAAQADERGHVEGTIATAGGEVIPFSCNVLPLLSEATLSRWGMPAGFTRFAENSLVPGGYVALMSPGGLIWLGRDGDVRGGKGGSNVIGLDIAE